MILFMNTIFSEHLEKENMVFRGVISQATGVADSEKIS